VTDRPVYAVIPSYERPKMLERCLDTLYERAGDLLTDHVVVKRRDHTYAVRNEGVKQVPDDAVVFCCDDDCWFPDMRRFDLQRDIEKATEPGVGIVRTTRRMGDRPMAAPEYTSEPTTWMGAGMLFEKSVWENVCGYPSDYLDDIMFGARVYGHGYRNYKSTYTYGRHDVDTNRGGMHQKMQEDEGLITECDPDRYGVQGDVVYSKGGRIENITNIRTTERLRDIHRTIHQLRTSTPEIPVQRCSWIDVAPALDAAAAADNIHVERDPRQQWYRMRDNTAVACRWEPRNHPGTHRLAHCWVAPDYRDEGKDEALVRARIADALQAGANRIDAYAHRTDLYERLGFEITDRATADGHDHVQLNIGYPDDRAPSKGVSMS